MKYDRHDRRAIQQLTGSARMIFEVIEREEKGQVVNVSGLCSALTAGPTFVLFSCLSGDGKREELGQDLGVLFTSKLRSKAEAFRDLLKKAGLGSPFLVLIDDTEPVRFWRWNMDQADATDWCRMVVEDTRVPFGWEVKLWSEVESQMLASVNSTRLSYAGFYESKIAEVKNSVLYHKLFQHIKKFPNKGLKDFGTHEAVVTKLIQYQFQRLLLRQMVPNAILIQTETPWEVKDPLFQSGGSYLSIIHPFEPRR